MTTESLDLSAPECYALSMAIDHAVGQVQQARPVSCELGLACKPAAKWATRLHQRYFRLLHGEKCPRKMTVPGDELLSAYLLLRTVGPEIPSGWYDLAFGKIDQKVLNLERFVKLPPRSVKLPNDPRTGETKTALLLS